MPHHIGNLRRRPLVWLAASVTVLALACGGGDPPEPTPTPAVAPVPSSVAIDLELADTMYVEGDTEGAVRIYSAAALRGSPEEKQHGLWSLARIQYEAGEQSKAAQNAEALLASEPEDDAQERRAYLLLGYAQMAQGKTEEAREALEKYIRLGGPATPYAQIKLAEIAAANDDPAEAARGAQAALAAELPVSAETELMFSLARYQEEAADIPGALATLETLSTGAATTTDEAEALWEIARLAAASGDVARQQTSLNTIISFYPDEPRALEALASSGEGTLPQRALVLFRQRQNDSAREAYAGLVADPDPNVAGDAHYRLGILAERAGDPGTALNEYAAAVQVLEPVSGALADDAYWDRGLVLQANGRSDEAVDHYLILADRFPGSDHASEALSRAAMIRALQGRPADATALWQRFIATSVSSDASGRANFWLARAYAELGDPAQQQAYLAQAAASAPDTYYGLRAAALLAGEASSADPSSLEPRTVDWSETETWLAGLVGPEPTPSPAAEEEFFASPQWLRAEEVLEAGLVELAIDESRAVIADETSAWTLYRIARRMANEGYVRTAALAAGTLVGYEDPPRALLTLVYPVKYLEQINAAAQEYGVSPLLLLALVRQESFFDAGAASFAGALGLTQVVPATGQDIAAALGITDFREADLFKPEVSLRFGAYYIASQLEGFGGNIAPALAAYNGGPGNAARWTETAGADPDLLLETIDFEETRSYLELVLEHYAFYRYVYGVSDTLSLPLS
jgi:soluble lytic murein transglycosylase